MKSQEKSDGVGSSWALRDQALELLQTVADGNAVADAAIVGLARAVLEASPVHSLAARLLAGDSGPHRVRMALELAGAVAVAQRPRADHG